MITANNQAAVAPTPTGNAYDMSADYLGKAGSTFGDFLTGEGSLKNINAYLNPYYENVLDRTLGRIGTEHQKSLGRIGDAAIAAGAFGGSRHGLVEAEAIGQHNLNVGDVTANIQQQGWQDAAERAFRDQVTGGQGLLGLGKDLYNIGNDQSDRQMRQGTMQQQLLQAILSGGQQEYDRYMNEPYGMLDMLNSLLSGDVRRGAGTSTATEQSTPGLYDYLSLGLQLF